VVKITEASAVRESGTTDSFFLFSHFFFEPFCTIRRNSKESDGEQTASNPDGK
jgi:hypothetical protein